MKILVADASAIAEWVFRTEAGSRVEQLLVDDKADIHIPALCDVELLAAIRRALFDRRLDKQRAVVALENYRDLPLTRHGHLSLLPRVFELRANFTAYDAIYVALADLLEATLVTADRSLARATAGITRVAVREV